MLVKTFRGCIRLGVLIALGASGLWSREVPNGGASMSISVYDEAGVGAKTIRAAEEIAWEVFRRAGVEVHWYTCGVNGELSHLSDACGKAIYPTNLQVRIVRRSNGLKSDIFGIAYLSQDGEGCYSEIFVEPMEELHKNFHVELASVLGHVAAHEVAHLLLGSNSHSAAGMMRARWQGEDLLNAERGALLFNKAEGEIMRARLSGNLVHGEQVSVNQAAPMGQRRR